MAATQPTELLALCKPRSHESGSGCARLVLLQDVDRITETVANNVGVGWVAGWVAGSHHCPVIKFFNHTKLALDKA